MRFPRHKHLALIAHAVLLHLCLAVACLHARVLCFGDDGGDKPVGEVRPCVGDAELLPIIVHLLEQVF